MRRASHFRCGDVRCLCHCHAGTGLQFRLFVVSALVRACQDRRIASADPSGPPMCCWLQLAVLLLLCPRLHADPGAG